MDRDLSTLDSYLDEVGADGYLVYADSADADQYFLSGFDAPDPFLTLYDGEVHLLFDRSLEYARAVRESDAATVERFVDYGSSDRSEEHGSEEASRGIRAAFLREYGVETVAVPPRFPVVTADDLREAGVDVVVDRDATVTRVRAVKTDVEIEHIRATQRANEAAMAAAEERIADADVVDGVLHEDGEPLTSEDVKTTIETTLLERGGGLDDTIVACGGDAADPHERGSGPLAAGEAIIVDIFPQHKTTNYHGDLTRTFCRGEPPETVREWYDLTAEAKAAALDAVEPGVTGEAVHDAACGVYEDAGMTTLRTDERAETGFIHSTGHGVGLEVHELPNVGPGGEELEPGNVITIEPGLYDPEVGGVRIEDLVAVTEDGHENLTDYPEHLRL